MNANLAKYRSELKITQISGTLALAYVHKNHFHPISNNMGITFFVKGRGECSENDSAGEGILENKGKWYYIVTINNQKLDDVFVPPHKVRIYTCNLGPFLFDMKEETILYESTQEKFKLLDFLLKPGSAEHFLH